MQAPRKMGRDPEADQLIALIASTADGDVGAFAALYDCTCARLYGVALQVLGDHEMAQQTIEEVYLHAWTTAHVFDPGDCSPQAWLATLTHRRAVDRVRIEQTYGKRILACDNGNRIVHWNSVTDDVSDIGACFGVASLDEQQRESIVLAYYGGLTYREVADRLGLLLTTVKDTLRSGLTRLEVSVGATRPSTPVVVAST